MDVTSNGIAIEKMSISMKLLILKYCSRNISGNYRGISLLDSAYKLYARILNQRLKTVSECMLLEESVTVPMRSEVWILAIWLLGSWVRIPLKAWMFVRVFLCCVVLCR
jgi:hypothetical protein